MPSLLSNPSEVYDLVGLGFGPANLAIAGAIVEQRNAGHRSDFPLKKCLFIERHRNFSWHPGMLLPDARMQISFMKDLATLRNPKSPITFLSYLHSQNRLVAFINRGSTVPSRKEFADYLAWAADYVQTNGIDVLYGHEVFSFKKHHPDLIQVSCRNVVTGKERTICARDIVISPGGSPRIPRSLDAIMGQQFVVHSSSYATSIDNILRAFPHDSRPRRVAVIGSGQSAAEVTLDLRERLNAAFPGAEHQIDMIFRKGSLKPSDDSPFANEIFDPASTDFWYGMSCEQTRATALTEYKGTNYGVVNPRTLDIVYEVIYNQKLDDGIAERTKTKTAPAPRINMLPYSMILSAQPNGEGVDFTLQHAVSNTVTERTYDAVICATGYQRTSWINMLKGSDVGQDYGLHEGCSTIQLLPYPSNVKQVNGAASREPIATLPLSPDLTPCGSPVESPKSEPRALEGENTAVVTLDSVYISRAYRLHPATGISKSRHPRIYLQGVEELTHGLSDTLLSVLGVRAAEVVADLCLQEEAESQARI